MVCSHCGAKNVEGARACRKCGQDLARPRDPDSLPSVPDSAAGPASKESVGEAGSTRAPEDQSAPEGAAASGVAAGTLVEGRYRLERELGRGGMGSVWLATDARLQMPVALKFIRRSQWQSASAYQRFLQEAKTSLGLSHPNIVHVYHLSEWAGQAYLAMEYINGPTLGDWAAGRRAKTGELDWKSASAVLRQILSGVAYAHSSGVIHRDLKPSNIMIHRRADGRERALVMDFGLAKSAEAPGQTRLGATLGTAYYQAPEQLGGAAKAGPRADVYSVGVIAYELLTGHLPIGGRAEPPSQLRRDLPEGVDEWVFRAIEYRAEKRFVSALEMAGALERIGKKAEPPPEPPPQRPSPPGEPGGRRKKKRLVLAALAFAAMVVVVFAVLAALTAPAPREHGGMGVPPVISPARTAVPPQITGGTPVPPSVAPTPRLTARATTAPPTPATASPTPVSTLVPRRSSLSSPGSNYSEAANGVNLEMIWIAGGTFQMGSPDSEKDRSDDEGPVHAVTLDGFWLGKTEVTQAQYEAVMGSNPSNFKGADNPVETVSWDDATQFCQKLSAASGKTYGLPTEAQWEYACRAGSQGRFCFGDDESQVSEYAWYSTNSGNQTHPVAQKTPNAWGLYDMHGNVWEWCADGYGPYGSSSERNPVGPSSATSRILRGGSWGGDAWNCRSAYRSGIYPVSADNIGGFRASRLLVGP